MKEQSPDYFETHISNSLFEVKKQVPLLLEQYKKSELTEPERKIIYETLQEAARQIDFMPHWR